MSSLTLTVTHAKQPHTITLPSTSTIHALKQELTTRTNVPIPMIKLMKGGLLKDETIIGEIEGIEKGRIVMVGTMVEKIIEVEGAKAMAPKIAQQHQETYFEPIPLRTEHKKVLEKGKPEQAEPGIKNQKMPYPSTYVKGLMNGRMMPCRLAVNKQENQVILSTNESTNKWPIDSITNVTSHRIPEHEEYSMVGLQMGPTEKSIIWLYWMPSQYVESLKDEILGAFVM